jgi:hypothetical protein
LGAVLTVLSALPCLGQSQLTVIKVHANQASQLSVPETQQKAQAQLQQTEKQLKQQLQKQMQQLVKSHSQIFNGKTFLYQLPNSKIATSRSQLAQRGCFTMRVFEYPKGFPNKSAKALPKVSECTPASRFHKQNLVQGLQIYKTKKQR